MIIHKLHKGKKQFDTSGMNSRKISSILKGNEDIPTSGMTLDEISEYLYTPEEIDEFNMTEAINQHPLAGRPTNMRSKMAYKEIMTTLKPTSKYLLPGQIVCFEYLEPKFKDQLEYYDRTPLVLFFGITKTNDGNIREVGLNLHYYPPHTRAKILNVTYNVFKNHFDQSFNEATHKANTFISYRKLKALLRHSSKIAFGVKMYIPVLRSASYVLPTRMLPTAFYTEGHFSKATLAQIRAFWRRAKR